MMSPTTLLRSSGRMSNPSLIIIHSLKQSANDFWTEAIDCTYCLCTMLSTDTLLLTISLKLQLYCRIQVGMTCCGHTESHTRQHSVSLLSHELHIFVQTLSYDNCKSTSVVEMEMTSLHSVPTNPRFFLFSAPWAGPRSWPTLSLQTTGRLTLRGPASTEVDREETFPSPESPMADDG